MQHECFVLYCIVRYCAVLYCVIFCLLIGASSVCVCLPIDRGHQLHDWLPSRSALVVHVEVPYSIHPHSKY